MKQFNINDADAAFEYAADNLGEQIELVDDEGRVLAIVGMTIEAVEDDEDEQVINFGMPRNRGGAE